MYLGWFVVVISVLWIMLGKWGCCVDVYVCLGWFFCCVIIIFGVEMFRKFFYKYCSCFCKIGMV